MEEWFADNWGTHHCKYSVKEKKMPSYGAVVTFVHNCPECDAIHLEIL